jgi:hypothetical protein
MASSAVLTGRTLSDVVYNGGILIVLMLSGVWLGLSVPTVEVAQQVGFTVLFPITFISNIFVPPGSLPSWLQPIADWNPSSTLMTRLRAVGQPDAPCAPRTRPRTRKNPGRSDPGFREKRSWLRGSDSNRRPSGYEPDELPLLHPACVR